MRRCKTTEKRADIQKEIDRLKEKIAVEEAKDVDDYSPSALTSLMNRKLRLENKLNGTKPSKMQYDYEILK